MGAEAGRTLNSWQRVIDVEAARLVGLRAASKSGPLFGALFGYGPGDAGSVATSGWPTGVLSLQSADLAPLCSSADEGGAVDPAPPSGVVRVGDAS